MMLFHQGPASAIPTNASNISRLSAKLRTHNIPAAIAHLRCEEFLPNMLRINPKIGSGIVMRGNIHVIKKLITPKTKAVMGAFSLSENEFRKDTISQERIYANPSSILFPRYHGNTRRLLK